MKKLFNVMMLFAALAIGFTSCKGEENNDNNDNNGGNTEVKGDYCHDIYLLDDFSKLVSNESLIDSKQTAKGWIRTEEPSVYQFSAAEGDESKLFMFVNYVHTPTSGDAFVYAMTAFQAGAMTAEIATQILTEYGFTKDQGTGQLTDGTPAAQGDHPTRDIRGLIYWEPSEQDPQVELVVMQMSAPI